METAKLIENLLLGGILGFLGQGIRAVAGLKKLSGDGGQGTSSDFDTRRMLVSLLLGFIAGALGIISFMDEAGEIELDQKMVLTLIGVGYSGVDFIESFLTKYVDEITTTTTTNANAGATGTFTATNVQTQIIRKPKLPYSSK